MKNSRRINAGVRALARFNAHCGATQEMSSPLPTLELKRREQCASAMEGGIYAASTREVQEALELSDALGSRTLKRHKGRAPWPP